MDELFILMICIFSVVGLSIIFCVCKACKDLYEIEKDYEFYEKSMNINISEDPI